jgi:hypothetical protein
VIQEVRGRGFHSRRKPKEKKRKKEKKDLKKG